MDKTQLAELISEISGEVKNLVEDEEDTDAFTFTMVQKVKEGQDMSEAFKATWKDFYTGKPDENPWEDEDE